MKENQKSRVFVQTIPDFCIFIDGKLLDFKSKKLKDILAAIIGRHGIPVSNKEIIQCVWKTQPDKKLLISYRVLMHRLKKLLSDLNISNIITEEKINRNIYHKANPTQYICDFIEITDKNPEYISRYKGQYMESYEWNASFKEILEFYINGQKNRPA